MMNVNMKPHNNHQLLDFLLTADFNKENGYSYSELLEFLNAYKYNYRVQDIEKSNLKRDLKDSEKELKQLLDRTKVLESRIEIQEKQIKNLKSTLNRKLTFWERIKGQFKY
jgi:predicted RNase H-like nuclease (RuvC/YqgF family)